MISSSRSIVSAWSLSSNNRSTDAFRSFPHHQRLGVEFVLNERECAGGIRSGDVGDVPVSRNERKESKDVLSGGD